MKTEVKTITPELASVMLESNTKNRSYIKKNVDYIANQMTSGKWMPTGNTIKFSETGRLLDGQHRLKAIVQAGKSYEFVVITGLKEEAFEVIDTGKVRTSKDILSSHGFKNPIQLSAASNILIGIEANGMNAAFHGGKLGNKTKTSNAAILNYAVNNPELNEIVSFVIKSSKKFNYLPVSQLSAMYYLIQKSNEALCDQFFSKYFEGDSLEKTSPIYVLRTQLMQESNSQIKRTHKEKFTWLITAWNYYKAGKTCTGIRCYSDRPIPTIA